MRTKPEKSKDDIELTATQNSALIYKIAYSYTKNSAEAEDILQDVLIAYMTSTTKYTDDEHKKAWLIRVTINECKKHFRRLKYQLLYDKTTIPVMSLLHRARKKIKKLMEEADEHKPISPDAK